MATKIETKEVNGFQFTAETSFPFGDNVYNDFIRNLENAFDLKQLLTIRNQPYINETNFMLFIYGDYLSGDVKSSFTLNKDGKEVFKCEYEYTAKDATLKYTDAYGSVFRDFKAVQMAHTQLRNSIIPNLLARINKEIKA